MDDALNDSTDARPDTAEGDARPGPGQTLVASMRGRACTTMSTDELMELLRGE